MYNDFRWSEASRHRNEILKEYEPLQPFFLLALAREAGCGTFLDVGANIGAYSLFMSSLPAIKRIFAFEPTPGTIVELRNNIRLNHLEDRVEVIEKAVSSAAGEVSFGIVDTMSGANSIVSTTIHKTGQIKREVTVECITLDSLAIPTDLPICMKIDVEGHEEDVLRGAQALLGQGQIILQCENYRVGEGALLDQLMAQGYAIIAHIGPDYYLTNMPQLVSATLSVQLFEHACQSMIAFNHSRPPSGLGSGEPIQLRGPSGVTVTLGGRSARYIHRLYNMVRPQLG